MFGLIEWTEQRQRGDPEVRERQILRLRFWGASILRRQGTPQALLRRRCRRAARQLQRLGVTRAVFPEDFPYTAEFARWGIRPVDPLPMYRALSGELVQAALEDRGPDRQGTLVAVCADRLTAEVRQAVTALCIRNRYVLLSAPDREGAFCRQLRREYGVPLVQTTDPAQLGRAGVVVLFSPRPGDFRGQTVLELYQGGTLPAYRLTLEGGEALPGGCDRPQLLGSLWTAGAIRPGQVAVSREKRREGAPSPPPAEKSGLHPRGAGKK